MEVYKIRSFAIGWHIVRSGFAIFLETKLTGPLEQLSKCDQPLAQEVAKPFKLKETRWYSEEE